MRDPLAGTSFAENLLRDGAHRADGSADNKEDVMGKYFLAWLLGVPAGLLVLIYVFTHVF